MSFPDAPDPTVWPCRPDLAAEHLRGIVHAERYAPGVPHQAARGVLAMRGRPAAEAAQTSELLYGEVFTVYETRDGWAWGQAAADDYVGYVRAEGLRATVVPPTHRVAALRAFVYPVPDVKAPPRDALGFGARVAVTGEADGFARLGEGDGWVAAVALAPAGSLEPDPVATALRFLGVPYLWGGRSSLGLDCSGLVQLALAASGIDAPRDTRLQVTSVGTLVGDSGAGPFARGDLVFFPGHVGIMADSATLLHANARSMAVTLDPVAEVAERVAASSGRGIVAVRRIDLPG